jgi:subtilisin family serine protease
MSQGRVAVVSQKTGLSAASAAPVEVDEADIQRECARIIDANRGVPLHCEANVLRFLKRTPNDPLFGDLYGLTQMDAQSAWDVTTGSSNVIVAVVDTGVYYNHADLIGNIAVNPGEVPSNGIDDDANGYIDDYFGYDFYDQDGDPVDQNGHGTHCAGIVGATGDDGSGIVGINWEVGILPVRALGANGGGSDADVAAGIQFAVHRGASVISLSLGGPSSSAVLDNAIQYARDAGVLVVAAAGNDADNNDIFPSYPANSPSENIVAVAATDSSDRLASFSNYGASSVHVAAPGSRILSTYLANQFVTMSGTSMATPYVAGLAALMKSVNPSLSYAELKYVLMASSDPRTELQGKVASNGRVNAYRAVMSAASGDIPPAPTPIAAPGQGGAGSRITIAAKRYGRRAIIHGYIRTAAREALADKRINLSCKRISARRTKSDEDGYYAFRVTRPRKAERCFVKDGFNNRSRSIVVR